MAATKRNPTNAENSKRLDAVEIVLENHENRIGILEKAKIATDAVADYLVKHPSVPQAENKLNKDLVKYIGVALGIIASLIYLIQGVRP